MSIQYSHEHEELLEQILHPNHMNLAWRQVRSNQGSAGIDKVSITAFPQWLNERSEGLVKRLLGGRYSPKPVRRVYIPKKPQGERPLGIPIVCDRVIQQSIYQILSPTMEECFSDYSYGFRPRKSAIDAACRVMENIRGGYSWAVDIDLKSFFDTVPHESILKLLRRHISDERVIVLIKRYLKAGVIEDGRWSQSNVGVPQGGPLSPLLSNLVLNELDQELEKREHRFVRYADDFVAQVRSEQAAKRVMTSLCRFIETKLKLTVNRSKSGIRHSNKLCYLGFCFKYNRTRVSDDSLTNLKHELKKLTGRSWSVSMKHRMHKIKRYVQGWMGYYGISQIYNIWLPMDQWLRRRIRMCYWKQWKRPKRRYLNLMKLGAKHNKAAGLARSSKAYWRISRWLGTDTGMTNKWLEQAGLISIKQESYEHKARCVTALKQTA